MLKHKVRITVNAPEGNDQILNSGETVIHNRKIAKLLERNKIGVIILTPSGSVSSIEVMQKVNQKGEQERKNNE